MGKQLEGSHLDSSDEAVQLAVTLAAAYFFRGDSGHAIRLCRKAIAKAEALQSPAARAAAYWNASFFEAEQGSVANAVPLAERALALLSEGQDTRNLARLRTQLGTMQLQLDPPDVSAGAAEPLDKAAEEIALVERQRDRDRTQRVARARAHYLDGNLSRAEEPAPRSSPLPATKRPSSPPTRSRSSGQIAAARGDTEGAKEAYRTRSSCSPGSARTATPPSCGSSSPTFSRTSATWMRARDAYRSAAASSGLRSRAKLRV